MADPVSFQGVTSGIKTDALVNAVVTQASQPMVGMQKQISAANARASALTSLQSTMTDLSAAIGTLNGAGFDARKVSSTDPDDIHVTATASGGPAGSYDLQVLQTATNARLSPTLVNGVATTLAVAKPSDPIFSGDHATFAVQGTDGVAKQIALGAGNNTLGGLADAINALSAPDPNVPGSTGLGVTATMVDTGQKSNPFQLILTSSKTGLGTAGGDIRLADITNSLPPPLPKGYDPKKDGPPPPPPPPEENFIGIEEGALTDDGSAIASGGNQSQQAAQNAVFSLDGIQLTRPTNTVSDAVKGVTFQLKQGGQKDTTTLTVTQDTDAATKDMQDVVTKFNAILTNYNTATATGGPLFGDGTARTLLASIRSSLTGSPAGLPVSNRLNSAASLGVKTNKDGSLSLDTKMFQAAMSSDPEAAKSVMATSGVSTNTNVSLAVAGPQTATGAFDFNITTFEPKGAVAGTVTYGGQQYTLTGKNGVLQGAADTPLEGLYLAVNGTGSGTMNISRGAGQATQDTIAHLTDSNSGAIAQVLKGITNANKNLNNQISSQQMMLDTMKTSLEKKYSDMEAAVTQMQAAGQSIGSLS
jgi:flagellar hook-associated protein 2